MKQVTLLESDLPKMLFSGFLSSRTTYQVRVEGPFGEREAKALRRMIDAHIEAATDDESHASTSAEGAAVALTTPAPDGGENGGTGSTKGSKGAAIDEATKP